MPPLDQSYSYDPMGNRRSATDQSGSTAYTANNANQYAAVGGVASVYDHNGNLLSDGVKNYAWDADNQLLSVSPVSPAEGALRVDYAYDWRMRRTSKTSFVYASGAWVLEKTTGYKYHEWNPVEESVSVSGSVTGVKRYVWGNDLSGGLHGAGGVGGLLSMSRLTTGVTVPGNFFYAYDSNGNVRALVKADAANPAASAIVERYAYGGFGRELTGSTPASASVNTFRFSTKQADAETGMNYYGYRFYDSNNGRWINRDPIAEGGGMNIYAMVGNNIISKHDYLGMWGTDGHHKILDAWLPAAKYKEFKYKCCVIDVVKEMAKGSDDVDGDVGSIQGTLTNYKFWIAQGSKNSYQHAMSAPGQSEDVARALMDQFIFGRRREARSTSDLARRYGGLLGNECETIKSALRTLGMAYHSASDETSPAHKGFQTWMGPIDGTFDQGTYDWFFKFVQNHKHREELEDLTQPILNDAVKKMNEKFATDLAHILDVDEI